MTEVSRVIVLECPWCDDELALDPRALRAAVEELHCASCGTTVALVDEQTEALPLAA